jgi:hypothetical protein
MRLQPKRAGVDGWINSGVPPPIRFVLAAVDLAMMSSAQWYGEFIADLAPERGMLREPQVMGIRGSSAANQARLLGNRFDVIAVTNPARLA